MCGSITVNSFDGCAFVLQIMELFMPWKKSFSACLSTSSNLVICQHKLACQQKKRAFGLHVFGARD